MTPTKFQTLPRVVPTKDMTVDACVRGFHMLESEPFKITETVWAMWQDNRYIFASTKN